MWLGLDAKIVSENIPTHVMEKLKGHLKKERHHLQSTKKPPPTQTINKTQQE